MAIAWVMPCMLIQCVLDEYTLVFLTHVLLGIKELVPELAKDRLGLSNGILHHETQWVVLV